MLHKLSIFALLVFSLTQLSCGKLRIPKAASTIALATTTTNWTAGLCVPVTMSLTSAGNAFFVPGTTNAQISLAGSLANVKFFESSTDCAATTPAVTSTTIASATSTKTIYVRSTTSGTLTLTVTLTGYSNTPSAVSLVSTQAFTVMADTPVDFIFTRQSAGTDLSLSDSLLTTSTCTAYYLYLKDTYGNRISATDFATLYAATYSTLTLNVTRNNLGHGAVVSYNDSLCGGANPLADNATLNFANALATYPLPFSFDPSAGSVAADVVTLQHDLLPTMAATTTLSITIN